MKHTVKEAAKAVAKVGKAEQCTEPKCPPIKCDKDVSILNLRDS